MAFGKGLTTRPARKSISQDVQIIVNSLFWAW